MISLFAGTTILTNHPSLILDVIWLVWLISWIIASFWSGLVRSRIATRQTWTYRAGLIVGGVLLVPYVSSALGETPLWSVGPGGTLFLAVLMVAGLGFTWSARLYLGRLWSSAITRKEGHRIVDTGPYALVRHPIYSGIIVGLVATAAAEPTRPALVGAAFVILGLYLKARFEERFLCDELGAEDYGAYCHRVAMMIPFLSLRWKTGRDLR